MESTDSSALNETQTFVDFTEDTPSAQGWNQFILSENASIQTINGVKGLGQDNPTDDILSTYFGIKRATPMNFSQGDIILVHWYNGGSETVNFIDSFGAATQRFKPLISLEDSNRPVDEEGESRWYPLRSTNYLYHHPNSSFSAGKLIPGANCTTLYTITQEDSETLNIPPSGVEQSSGEHSIINISPRVNVPGLLCTKIEYISRAAAAPGDVELHASFDNGMVTLNWSEAQLSNGDIFPPAYYRIYKNDQWLDVTDQLTYTDVLNERGITNSYHIVPMNIRTAGNESNRSSVYIPPLTTRTDLINPSTDLEYAGAFRLPSNGTGYDLKGEMAFYPSTGSGSLYMHGQALKHKVEVINIPTPLITDQYDSLPRASLIGEPADFAPSNAQHPTQQGKNGLAYIPWADRFFASTANYYYQGGGNGAIPPSHSSFTPDFSQVSGMWYIGEKHLNGDHPPYNGFSGMMACLPQGWSQTNGIDGFDLLVGMNKPNHSPHGPTIYAVNPWSAPGEIYPDERELNYIPLLEYSDENELHGWMEQDNWYGMDWYDNGIQSSVIISGNKARGEYYYGFYDKSVVAQRSDTIPSLPYIGGKGPKCTSSEPMLLFYDPQELARSARGEIETWEMQPYAIFPLAEYMFSPPGSRESSMGTIAIDSGSGKIYIRERIDINDYAIHVFNLNF